jgi:Glycosyl transferase family 2
VQPSDLLLAPNDLLLEFPNTIACHVQKRMIPEVTVSHYVFHKGMLSHVDPAHVLEAGALTPVFANEVFVVFSRRGARLQEPRAHHLLPFQNYLAGLVPWESANHTTAVVVTTHNRPWALKRTLKSLSLQPHPMLVVDDGSSPLNRLRNRMIAKRAHATYVSYPVNLGLAHALNIGLCHWLAQPQVEWISTFNDDVEVVPDGFNILAELVRQSPYPPTATLFTGFESRRHPAVGEVSMCSHRVLLARSCPAKHLHAHRAYWQSVLPIPTAYVGAPKQNGGLFAGQGSDADWWVGSWSPHSAPKRGGYVIVIPGMVTSFASGPAASTWGNSD